MKLAGMNSPPGVFAAGNGVRDSAGCFAGSAAFDVSFAAAALSAPDEPFEFAPLRDDVRMASAELVASARTFVSALRLGSKELLLSLLCLWPAGAWRLVSAELPVSVWRLASAELALSV
jgi:hypothetical protein